MHIHMHFQYMYMYVYTTTCTCNIIYQALFPFCGMCSMYVYAVCSTVHCKLGVAFHSLGREDGEKRGSSVTRVHGTHDIVTIELNLS